MDSLKIVQQNVQSWSDLKVQELSNLYFSLDPDIILINDTGIPDTKRIKLFSYRVYQRNTSGERASGIAIAVRSTLEHRIIDELNGDVLGVRIETSRGPVIVATTYLPPRRNEWPRQEILSLMRKPLPVYLIADLNANHPAFGHGRSNFLGEQFYDFVRRGVVTFLGPDFYTFIGGNNKGKPDLALTNRHHHFNYALLEGPLTSSDHLPMVCQLSTKPIAIPTLPRPSIKEANWDVFKETVADEINLWQEPEGVKDRNYVDQRVDFWFKAIERAKIRGIPHRSHKRLPHPRDSEELRQLRWQYSLWRNHTRVYGTNADTTRRLRELQERLKEESKRLYNEHWDTLIGKIQDVINDPKEFWSKIRRLLGSGETVTPYIMHNNRKCFSPAEQEEVFRAFWSKTFTITPEENRRFDQDNERLVLETLRDRHNDITPYETVDLSRLDPANPLIAPVEVDEIKFIIRSFKNKAPGLSQVNKIILSQLPEEAIRFYKEMTDETISMGYFPVAYKKGLFRFKGKPEKDLKQVENYRPISLLEVPGKILERVMKWRLNSLLEDKNLQNPNQHGFTRGKGTHTAIANIYEFTANSQREGGSCMIISRDVRKAFDKVWHEGLKYKFVLADPPKPFLPLLCSFLDDRKAAIKIGNHIGPEFPLLSGVPQGSVLSPTLYCHYVSDTPAPSPGSLQALFADDHTLVVTYPNKNKRALKRKAIREIEAVNEYEKKWKISTNINKFQLLLTSARRQPDILIDNQLVAFRNSINVLGYRLGIRGLQAHVTQRVAAARGTVQKLKRFRNLTSKTKLRLYKTLVRPTLEYPAVGLCQVSKTTMHKMQVIQNKVLRFVFNQAPPYYNTVRDLHMQCKLEPLNTRLHRLANRTWDKLAISDPEFIERARQISQAPGRDHNWWPRLATVIEEEPPEPRFIL